MPFPVIDLHCDLLAYLSEDHRHQPSDDASRCSLPLLKKGGVLFQALAVFTKTGSGSCKGFERQLECYKGLKGKESPQFVLAIENASGLLEEGEPFHLLLERFEKERWLYVSLTWKTENRFGGGDTTQVGLKEDGKRFLEYLEGKGVAIDLSHASDPLAEDILSFIQGKDILPIASHSNFRSIKKHPRNLPDSLAREIIQRGGVIGINFVRHFVGNKPKDFIRHIAHAFSLGGENALALGADFFGGSSLPDFKHLKPLFQEPYSNSSCYPQFYGLLVNEFGKERTEKIFYKNCQAFAKDLMS